jgi:hypothetical protein
MLKNKKPLSFEQWLFVFYRLNFFNLPGIFPLVAKKNPT